ncbi:MAG TPA: fused MFS/spermidine synthase [Gemmatimonadaceae bacterium]|nr:fused MFS/spermidine synthase [Gemmatimonadaceae bacterium]
MTSPAIVDRRHAMSAVVFTLAIFVNATLLFAVQPMFTKLVLPRLGGTPAVWNTCLLFFQGALLAGYLYAHLGAKVLTARTQALVHLALLFVAMVSLPIGIPAGFERPVQGVVPIAWLIALLVVALGAPVTLVAAGAPILQRWFAATDHPRAHNPYFLYAASNLGSFVALLSYPFLIEPNMRLVEQRRWWSIGYLTLLTLIALCAFLVWRSGRRAASTVVAATPEDAEDAPALPTIVPNAHWRLRWVLLSFVPSSLLVGVTTFISTDIASVPLLWVIPLALYLLSFVLVFAQRPVLHRGLMLWLQLPLVLMLLVALAIGGTPRITMVAGLHLLAFFVTAMVCHRELADSRPRAEYLTGFYLWIAVGGLLGGTFNVLLAPALYDTVREYPYALIVALGLRPALGMGRITTRRSLALDIVLPALLFAVVLATFKLPSPPSAWGSWGTYIALGVGSLIAATFVRRPLRLALGAAAVFAAYQSSLARDEDVLVQARSFFGVYRVKNSFQYNVLTSGTTTHGGQNLVREKRTEPLTYYHRGGPLGQFFSSTLTDVPLRRVAAVGLGAGTVACYGRAEEAWTFYEIDPVMLRIASSPRLFTYLQDCPPETDVVIGDARLSLATTPDSTFDLILLDAFSSDAIPVHLLTREALAMYMRKLRPAGVVLLHISNRYLELRPVVVELARDARLAGAIGDYDVTPQERLELKHGSRWVALARSPQTLAVLVRQSLWRPLDPRADVAVWTDDFSDILGVLRWRR